MQTVTAETVPYTFQDFIDDVAVVRKKEMEEYLPFWLELARLQQEHPRMVVNENLFRAPDGTLWTHAPGGFCRYHRNPTFLQRLQFRFGWYEVIPELPKGSQRGKWESWVWEYPSWTKSPEEQLEYSLRRLGEHLSAAKESHEVIQFIDHILAESRREELEQWFLERARTSDRTAVDICWEDEEMFVQAFDKERHFTDDPRKIVLNYAAEIHRLLDALAGRADIRRWY